MSLYYNLYTDSYFERMPLTSNPAPFLEIYYVPVRMRGRAVSLVFFPDKRAPLGILQQSGKYDVLTFLSHSSSEVTGSVLLCAHLTFHV